MQQSVKAAVSGVFVALSVALMFCGSLFYVFTYFIPIMLGILIVIMKKTFSNACAWFVYIGTGIISFILVPDKETVLMYVLFFGYYPIIKSGLDRIKFKTVKILIKFIIFNIAVCAVEVIAYFVFGIPFFEEGNFSVAMIVVFAVLMNIVFVLYDLLLKKFLFIYEKKIEKRILYIFKH